MKTICIAHNYTEDSFAYMSYNLAHHLAHQGYRVLFISHKPYFNESFTKKIESGEIIVYSWNNSSRPTGFKSFLWFIKLFLKYRPSTVIGHFVGSNITIIVSKLLSFGKTYTMEYYHTLSSQNDMDSKNSNLRNSFLRLRKKIFYKVFCDIVICPSKFSQFDIEIVFKIKKTIVIVNPMKDRFLNSTVNKNLNPVVFSYLGRLDPSKNIEELINAFNLVREKFIGVNIVLQIAGGGQMEAKVREESNGINIIFKGVLKYSEIDTYIRSSHYIIIPSKYDNLPTVGLESIMNGIPVLISKNTGLSEYFTDSYNGFVFEPDIPGIVLAFEKAIKNLDKFETLSKNARSLFENTFTVEKYNKKIDELIN